MLREIVLLGDEVLRRKARPVAGVGAAERKLIDDLLETMDAANGLGLAAPQIGVGKRIVVVHDGECDPFALVNPKILKKSGRDEASEGCLSMPGLFGMVTRSKRLSVVAQDRSGREIRLDAEGLLARVIQHELDHLNGVLFIDHTTDLWFYARDDDDEDEETLIRIPTTVAEVHEHFARERAERQKAAR